jgi:hypothetical protein
LRAQLSRRGQGGASREGEEGQEGEGEGEEEEEEECGRLLETPFEPLTVLYFSTPVRKWERDNLHALPPEV